MLHAPRNRFLAALLHVCLSLLIVGGIGLAVFLAWFPAGLHKVARLDTLFGVMLAVDVVAGPLLTLLVYKPGKPSLRFDLTVIALLQLAFLGYGLHTLWQSRPLFLVGSADSFALVFANEVPADATRGARENGWHRFHRTGPWLVGIRVDDAATRHGTAVRLSVPRKLNQCVTLRVTCCALASFPNRLDREKL